MGDDLFTIGHSNHSATGFIELLGRHGVTAVADVRSHPYSRHNPQFRKRALEASLAGRGIAYVFLGSELGARRENPACYVDGRVQYQRVAGEASFQAGLERVLTGMQRYRVALMCAEKDPAECHRAILVSRELRSRVSRIGHILADGSVEWRAAFERRLMALHGLAPDMLTTEAQCIEAAYDRQGQKIAWVDDNMKSAAH